MTTLVVFIWGSIMFQLLELQKLYFWLFCFLTDFKKDSRFLEAMAGAIFEMWSWRLYEKWGHVCHVLIFWFPRLGTVKLYSPYYHSLCSNFNFKFKITMVSLHISFVGWKSKCNFGVFFESKNVVCCTGKCTQFQNFYCSEGGRY